MQNALTNSYLWKEPNTTTLVNLSLKGIQFPLEMDQIRFPRVERYYVYSNDAKYFAFINEEKFYIINCIEEQAIQQISLYLRFCDNFKFSADSEYFIFVEHSFSNQLYIYKKNNELFEQYDLIDIEGEIMGSVEFSILENIVYLLSRVGKQTFQFQTYNLVNKQLTVPTLYKFKQLCNKLTILFTICKSTIIFNASDSKVYFLTNINGKVLRGTKQYNSIDGIFGLDKQENIFRLYCVNNNKLIQKFHFHLQFNQYYCQIAINLSNNDLIVRINAHNQQQTSSYEIKWFQFKIIVDQYHGLRAINKKGAFNMLEEDIFEFYYF